MVPPIGHFIPLILVSSFALSSVICEITFANGEKFECWRMATKSTIQVMTGITYHMKKAGYVVTLVPMSTQVYSGEEDKSANSNLRNEIVKYRKQPYAGGKPIDGTNQVDVLDLADAVLLQWYSGFDAALCANLDDPKACSCDNVPDEDYPNVLNVSKDGLISSYWSANGERHHQVERVQLRVAGKRHHLA